MHVRSSGEQHLVVHTCALFTTTRTVLFLQCDTVCILVFMTRPHFHWHRRVKTSNGKLYFHFWIL